VHDALERKIMSNFVNSEEKIVVGRGANYVCSEKESGGRGPGVPEKKRSEQLDRHHRKNNPFCYWFVSHKFSDLSGGLQVEFELSTPGKLQTTIKVPLDASLRSPCVLTGGVLQSLSKGNRKDFLEGGGSWDPSSRH
jgi:hypothetical protein